MLLDLSLHGFSNDSSKFLLGLLLVFICLARPGLVAVVTVFLARIAAVLGVVRPIGSVSLAVVRRLLLFLLACLGLLGVFFLDSNLVGVGSTLSMFSMKSTTSAIDLLMGSNP